MLPALRQREEQHDANWAERQGRGVILPVADPWYAVERIDARTIKLTEPRVHPVFSANIFIVEGSDADLVIDSGMGVAPLRPVLDAARRDVGRPLVCFTTHAHVDHIGSVHEFDVRLVHSLEAEEMASPGAYSLRGGDVRPDLAALFERAGYPPLWPLLIDAAPAPGYDPDAWRLRGADATGVVGEGDTVDLGDWRAEVVHLPGHSPGQCGLLHRESATLFSADAVYDGPLIWDGPGMSVVDYADTLRRLRALPVETVHGGHDPSFGRARFDEIIETHLRLWGA